MLGSLILYLQGMRIVMFQLSGFYRRVTIRDLYGYFGKGLGFIGFIGLVGLMGFGVWGFGV